MQKMAKKPQQNELNFKTDELEVLVAAFKKSKDVLLGNLQQF